MDGHEKGWREQSAEGSILELEFGSIAFLQVFHYLCSSFVFTSQTEAVGSLRNQTIEKDGL
jgi:hypothetical protein